MITVIMLDLSVAFDMIDEPILLRSLGIKDNLGKVVPQRVSVADKTSPDLRLYFGVQQGSVLGKKNYCMYSKPISGGIKRKHCLHTNTVVFHNV